MEIPFACPTCFSLKGAQLEDELRDDPTRRVLSCLECSRNFGVSLIDLAAMERAGTHGWR